MKGGSFMANTEIFLRNIFGTTRPNIRPQVHPSSDAPSVSRSCTQFQAFYEAVWQHRGKYVSLL